MKSALSHVCTSVTVGNCECPRITRIIAVIIQYHCLYTTSSRHSNVAFSLGQKFGVFVGHELLFAIAHCQRSSAMAIWSLENVFLSVCDLID